MMSIPLNQIIDIQRMTAFSHDLADAAAKVTLKYFRHSLNVECKPELISNMASIADREAEDVMVALIQKNFPDFGVIREEGENIPSKNGFYFVLDPIDGTSSFIAGRPIWGTLISLVNPKNEAIIGIIDQPFLKERFLGVIGNPSTLNGQIIRSNKIDDLAQTIVLKTTPKIFRTEREKKILSIAEENCGNKSIWGGDCYSYAGLAAGFGAPSVVLECDMKYFDFAALIPVIEGAGGKITNWKGQALGPTDTEVLACSNPSLHGKILSLVQSVAMAA